MKIWCLKVPWLGRVRHKVNYFHWSRYVFLRTWNGEWESNKMYLDSTTSACMSVITWGVLFIHAHLVWSRQDQSGWGWDTWVAAKSARHTYQRTGLAWSLESWHSRYRHLCPSEKQYHPPRMCFPLNCVNTKKLDLSKFNHGINLTSPCGWWNR